ncbi:hypothetical protein IFM89_018132 [Coptis chinensis]|uniref:Beta-amylase n=1 Tax=Coptis chinensis TaxID=261450 RepID=A0A835HVZ6_9MAGN|nr:hypothetical protein IFM89_018132 [Coptis chinensis]
MADFFLNGTLHYGTESHPSEFTAGYYNTFIRDGYLPIARLFGRYGVILCCVGFEMRDSEEKQMHPLSSSEGFFRQILLAARASDLPLDGENSTARLNNQSLQQVLKMSRFYSDGLDELFFSFNFVRMGQTLFERDNWTRFTEFVKQISHGSNFQAKLNFGGSELCLSTSAAKKVRVALAYC